VVRIAFAWPGLPDYAARCIRAVIDRQIHVTVIGTRPEVPIEGMEASLGQQVRWIDGHDIPLTFEKLGLDPPEIFFCGGYAVPAMRSLTADCNERGIPVILLSDNYLHGSLMSRAAVALRHRLILRRRYSGIFVPGEAGRAYALAMGYRPAQIRTGLYSADPTLFHDGPPLCDRRKRFLFVGSFIDRKNVLVLTEAFIRFAQSHPDWELCLCGSGPLKARIPEFDRILVHDFVQPHQLAEMMQEARCLVLPSLKEHFGLVVHEAALSGCALALSDAVGAGADLATADNAIVFHNGDTAAIQRTLDKMAGWSDAQWRRAERNSVDLAARISPGHFANSIEAFVREMVS